MSNINVKTGSVTGTGAAINVSIGFLPVYVRVMNVTDADTVDEWFSTMANGTSITTAAAVATRATNGISSYAGSSTAGQGFTIGSGISESAKVLAYLAIGAGPGND